MNHKHAKLITCVLISMAFLSLLLVACTRPGSIPVGVLANSGDADSGGNAVHMNSAQFVQPSITLKKGASLTLIDDVAVPHTIFNGSWMKGVAQTKQERGAPTVQLQFVGNDTQRVGPFNATGTFHLFCSLHEGMNLTVIVQ